jgi:hypothetical protein
VFMHVNVDCVSTCLFWIGSIPCRTVFFLSSGMMSSRMIFLGLPLFVLSALACSMLVLGNVYC